ncbi:MAG TPA: BAX inhibitor (BI)-1/YccA family protein, partial [Allosphingosinicella sp.]
MANWSDPRIGTTASPATRVEGDVAFDAGLRRHMLSVYNYMASGVLLTGIVAYAAAMMGIPQALFTGG